MLQLATKMYFRDGVPLHSTIHRDVLYTNRSTLRAETVKLPVGELAFSDQPRPVSSATASVEGHLEAKMADGSDSVVIAVGGPELIDDLADVLSFGLNSVFSRDRDLVRRLVPPILGEANTEASALFTHTFDPQRTLLEPEIDEFRGFMQRLLALRRENFEQAMRAIRRIVHAIERAAENPTIAYVDLVASLESLSDGAEAPATIWERFDHRKRSLIDGALDGAPADTATRVRKAVLEAERAGVKRRFVAFVMGNVGPSFFRAEASATAGPVRGADLERLVKLAYDIRSQNVHVLRDLPDEAWVLGEGVETVELPAGERLLNLQGLARLARHVVGNYIAGAPAEVDSNFDWRAILPGQIRVRLAPEYWLPNRGRFDISSAPGSFAAFAAEVARARAGRSKGVPDIQGVLEKIEELVPSTADGPAKQAMVGMYALWHSTLVPDGHRPDAEEFLARYEQSLDLPDVVSFVTRLLQGTIPTWNVEQWHDLAAGRRQDRMTRKHQALPAEFDAALQVVAAEAMLESGKANDAMTFARYALEECPGNEALIAWEAALGTESPVHLDVGLLGLGLDPRSDDLDDAEDEVEDQSPGEQLP